MPPSGTDPFERAAQTAHVWMRDIARSLDTDDRRFAYRALRAWLHTLRDRLPVSVATHLGAQLPDLLRGVYYEGWNPNGVPVKYDRDAFVARFAHEARISAPDVMKIAPEVTRGLRQHLSAGQVTEVLDELPHGVRSLLEPVPATSPR